MSDRRLGALPSEEKFGTGRLRDLILPSVPVFS
jgi:hypothetical protein